MATETNTPKQLDNTVANLQQSQQSQMQNIQQTIAETAKKVQEQVDMASQKLAQMPMDIMKSIQEASESLMNAINGYQNPFDSSFDPYPSVTYTEKLLDQLVSQLQSLPLPEIPGLSDITKLLQLLASTKNQQPQQLDPSKVSVDWGKISEQVLFGQPLEAFPMSAQTSLEDYKSFCQYNLNNAMEGDEEQPGGISDTSNLSSSISSTLSGIDLTSIVSAAVWGYFTGDYSSLYQQLIGSAGQSQQSYQMSSFSQLSSQSQSLSSNTQLNMSSIVSAAAWGYVTEDYSSLCSQLMGNLSGGSQENNLSGGQNPQVPPELMNILQDLLVALQSLATSLPMAFVKMIFDMLNTIIGLFKQIAGVIGVPSIPYPLSLVPQCIPLVTDIMEFIVDTPGKMSRVMKAVLAKKTKEMMEAQIPKAPSNIEQPEVLAPCPQRGKSPNSPQMSALTQISAQQLSNQTSSQTSAMMSSLSSEYDEQLSNELSSESLIDNQVNTYQVAYERYQ